MILIKLWIGGSIGNLQKAFEEGAICLNFELGVL